MITTDPIADMLTRIRNGHLANKAEVLVPYSKIKASIAEILVSNGYLGKVKVDENGAFKQLSVSLSAKNIPESMVRVSKPGRRIYTKAHEIPTVRSGRGLVIVSTPTGIMSGQDAKKAGLGGELICKVY